MSRFALFFVFVSVVVAQDTTTVTDNKPVLNLLIDRVGFGRDVNYGYLEWFQIRPTHNPKVSVIGPDVGVIFFDNLGRYREFFAGVGVEWEPTASLTIDHEEYVAQATGPDAHGKTYYQPWTRLEYHFPKKVMLESVIFPYIPLNGGAYQLVVERVKLQYTGFKHFSVGGGYGAYKDFTGQDLQNKPFASVTVKTKRFGDFEFWGQLLPKHGFQIQYRHVIKWRSRH